MATCWERLAPSVSREHGADRGGAALARGLLTNANAGLEDFMSGHAYRLGALAVGALLVAGCGQSYDALERDFIEMADRVSQLGPTPLDTMPNAGGARYRGVASVDFPVAEVEFSPGQTEFVAGFGRTTSRMTLDADFGRGTVTGVMSDWAKDSGNRIDSKMDGTLRVFVGHIDENTLSAAATGRLDDGDRSGRVDLDLGGVFVGDGARGVIGGMDGSARYRSIERETGADGVRRTLEREWGGPVAGDFVLERR
jgi:hypothetical protein